MGPSWGTSCAGGSALPLRGESRSLRAYPVRMARACHLALRPAEALQLTGKASFLEPVWWKVGYAKLTVRQGLGSGLGAGGSSSLQQQLCEGEGAARSALQLQAAGGPPGTRLNSQGWPAPTLP